MTSNCVQSMLHYVGISMSSHTTKFNYIVINKHYLNGNKHTFLWDMCSRYDVKSDFNSESTSESILIVVLSREIKTTYKTLF